ncbi:hypothetical protein [Streptomyces sp. NPDC048527]|uniref:hypothetical protein n=1 Tax=Streptomyces sp. NPDC048527 TaxID=3365568 RepID=UPI0037217EBC
MLDGEDASEAGEHLGALRGFAALDVLRRDAARGAGVVAGPLTGEELLRILDGYYASSGVVRPESNVEMLFGFLAAVPVGAGASLADFLPGHQVSGTPASALPTEAGAAGAEADGAEADGERMDLTFHHPQSAGQPLHGPSPDEDSSGGMQFDDESPLDDEQGLSTLPALLTYRRDGEGLGEPPAWMDEDYRVWWRIVTDSVLDERERGVESLVEELTAAGVHWSRKVPGDAEQRARMAELFPEVGGVPRLRELLELVAEALRLGRADNFDLIEAYQQDKSRALLVTRDQLPLRVGMVRSVTDRDPKGRVRGVSSLPPVAGDDSGAQRYRVQSEVRSIAFVDARGVEGAVQELPFSDPVFLGFGGDGQAGELAMRDGSSRRVPYFSIARYFWDAVRGGDNVMVLGADIATWDAALDPLERPVAGQDLADRLGRNVVGSSAGGELEVAPWSSESRPPRVRLRNTGGRAEVKLVAFRPVPSETVLRAIALRITGDEDRWKEVRRWVRALRWVYGPTLPFHGETFQGLLEAFWQLEQRRASAGDTDPLTWKILSREMRKQELPPERRPEAGRNAELLSQLLGLGDELLGPWLEPTYALPESDSDLPADPPSSPLREQVGPRPVDPSSAEDRFTLLVRNAGEADPGVAAAEVLGLADAGSVPWEDFHRSVDAAWKAGSAGTLADLARYIQWESLLVWAYPGFRRAEPEAVSEYMRALGLLDDWRRRDGGAGALSTRYLRKLVHAHLADWDAPDMDFGEGLRMVLEEAARQSGVEVRLGQVEVGSDAMERDQAMSPALYKAAPAVGVSRLGIGVLQAVFGGDLGTSQEYRWRVDGVDALERLGGADPLATVRGATWIDEVARIVLNLGVGAPVDTATRRLLIDWLGKAAGAGRAESLAAAAAYYLELGRNLMGTSTRMGFAGTATVGRNTFDGEKFVLDMDVVRLEGAAAGSRGSRQKAPYRANAYPVRLRISPSKGQVTWKRTFDDTYDVPLGVAAELLKHDALRVAPWNGELALMMLQRTDWDDQLARLAADASDVSAFYAPVLLDSGDHRDDTPVTPTVPHGAVIRRVDPRTAVAGATVTAVWGRPELVKGLAALRELRRRADDDRELTWFGVRTLVRAFYRARRRTVPPFGEALDTVLAEAVAALDSGATWEEFLPVRPSHPLAARDSERVVGGVRVRVAVAEQRAAGLVMRPRQDAPAPGTPARTLPGPSGASGPSGPSGTSGAVVDEQMVDLTSDDPPSGEEASGLDEGPSHGPSSDDEQMLDDGPFAGGQGDGTWTGGAGGAVASWDPFAAPWNPLHSAAPNMLPDVISYDPQVTNDEQMPNYVPFGGAQEGALRLDGGRGSVDPWNAYLPTVPPKSTDPNTSLEVDMGDDPPLNDGRPLDSIAYDEDMGQPESEQVPEQVPEQVEQPAPVPAKPPAWMDEDHQMWWYVVTDYLLDDEERSAEALVEELTEAGVHLNQVGPPGEAEQRATMDDLFPELEGAPQLRKTLELVAEAQRLSRADSIESIREYRREKSRAQLFAMQQGWFPAGEVRSVTHPDHAGRVRGVFSLPPVTGDPSGAEKYRVQTEVRHFALVDAGGAEGVLQELTQDGDVVFVGFASDGKTAVLTLRDGSSRRVPFYSIARYLWGAVRHVEDIMVLDGEIAVWDAAVDPLERPVGGQVLANHFGRTVWGASAGGVLEVVPASGGRPARVRLRRVAGAPPGVKLKLVAFRPEPVEGALRAFALRITGDEERWKDVRRWVRALRWWYGPPLPAHGKAFQGLLVAFWQLEQRRASSGDTEPLSWEILVTEMTKRELPPGWRREAGRQAALLSQLLRLGDHLRGPWLAPTYALPEADLPLAPASGDDLDAPLEETLAGMAGMEETLAGMAGMEETLAGMAGMEEASTWPWALEQDPEEEEQVLAQLLNEAIGDLDQAEQDREDPPQ